MNPGLFRMKLRPEELLSLKTHKFAGVNNSILSKYVINHYNRWLIRRIPETISPNVLTLCGYVMMMTSLLLTMVLDPYLNDAPKYLPLANFFLMFAYFTFDNLDGMQARKTNSASPLGQLLDHGVDSCCALATSIALSSSLGFGLSRSFVALMLAVMTQFYLVGLEEKFTGNFVLGRISGASEGVCFVLVLHLVSFVCGKDLFQHMLSDKFLWPVRRACSVLGMDGLEAASVIIAAISLFNIATSMVSIVSKMQSSKVLSLYLTSTRILSLIWSFVVLHNILRTESVDLQYLNILIFGQVFSIKYISEIYSYIIGNDTLIFMPLYLVYLAVSTALQLQLFKTYSGMFLHISFVLSSVCYMVSVTRVVLTLTEALGISFLSINRSKKTDD